MALHFTFLTSGFYNYFSKYLFVGSWDEKANLTLCATLVARVAVSRPAVASAPEARKVGAVRKRRAV
jgi:hypothetical protein